MHIVRIDATGDPEAIRRPLNAYCKALKKAGVNHNIFVRTNDGWKLTAVFDRQKNSWYVLKTRELFR